MRRWHIGHTWGGFARTRVLAGFKQRIVAKKLRKRAPRSSPSGEAQINRIRSVKAGQARRASGFNSGIEAQLRGVIS